MENYKDRLIQTLDAAKEYIENVSEKDLEDYTGHTFFRKERFINDLIQDINKHINILNKEGATWLGALN